VEDIDSDNSDEVRANNPEPAREMFNRVEKQSDEEMEVEEENGHNDDKAEDVQLPGETKVGLFCLLNVMSCR